MHNDAPILNSVLKYTQAKQSREVPASSANRQVSKLTHIEVRLLSLANELIRQLRSVYLRLLLCEYTMCVLVVYHPRQLSIP